MPLASYRAARPSTATSRTKPACTKSRRLLYVVALEDRGSTRFTALKISAAVGWLLCSIKNAITAWRCAVQRKPLPSKDCLIASAFISYLEYI
jgi:hypothetical protein